jgi:predicted permease
MVTAEAIRHGAESTAGVLVVCSIGAWLARKGKLGPALRKGLSSLAKTALLPCLLLSRAAASVSLEACREWWPIPLFALLWVVLGALIGSVVSALVKAVARVHNRRLDSGSSSSSSSSSRGQRWGANDGARHTHFIMAASAFGNSTSLPLALAASLVRTAGLQLRPAAPADGDGAASGDAAAAAAATAAAGVERAVDAAVAYVLFYTIFMTIARWSLAYDLLRPPPPRAGSSSGEGGELEGGGELELTSSGGGSGGGGSSSSSSSAADPTDGGGGTLALRAVARIVDGGEGNAAASADAAGAASTERAAPAAAGAAAYGTRQRLRKAFLNEPVLAALLAFVVGIIPAVKGLFFGEGAPLKSVLTAPLTTVGAAYVPAVFLQLGGSMSEGPGGRPRYGDLLVVTLTRLLLLPAAAVGTLRLLRSLGWVPPDRVFALCMLLEAASPSAINLSVMTVLHNWRVRQMATMLFFQYAFAPVTMGLWLSVFLVETQDLE